MPIATSCPCGRKLNLKDDLAGKTVKCPQCGNPLRVPDGKSTATAVATPPPIARSGVDSKVVGKKPPGKKDDSKAGPKLMMGNFKSLEDFDETGQLKKKKKEWTKEDEEASEVGTTGGAMAQIAKEALSAEKEKPKFRCPGCGKGVKQDDVICMKCGTNIKTGRRIGESGITIKPARLIGVLVILAICAAGAAYHFLVRMKPKGPPQNIVKADALKEEIAGVQAALEGLITDMDPEVDRMRPYVAHLGLDALPVLSKFVSSGTGLQKRKAVKLLEMLAYNRYRSAESVTALAGLARDPDPAVRQSATEALFWSAVDQSAQPYYWAPDVTDPQRKTDCAKLYALPHSDCREVLQKSVAAIKTDKHGRVTGDLGRVPTKADVVKTPSPAEALEQMWQGEMDTQQKLSALIQTVRAGRTKHIEMLIEYLNPSPKKLSAPASDNDKQRAWRCLRDITGRSPVRWDDWDTWWKTTGMKMYVK